VLFGVEAAPTAADVRILSIWILASSRADWACVLPATAAAAAAAAVAAAAATDMLGGSHLVDLLGMVAGEGAQ
jgi:hypothetical protein